MAKAQVFLGSAADCKECWCCNGKGCGCIGCILQGYAASVVLVLFSENGKVEIYRLLSLQVIKAGTMLNLSLL